jgi:hypothetical protein
VWLASKIVRGITSLRPLRAVQAQRHAERAGRFGLTRLRRRYWLAGEVAAERGRAVPGEVWLGFWPVGRAAATCQMFHAQFQASG